MPARIPFNKPFIAGKELHYIAQAVTLGNIATAILQRSAVGFWKSAMVFIRYS
jgi:hypothetical protein